MKTISLEITPLESNPLTSTPLTFNPFDSPFFSLWEKYVQAKYAFNKVVEMFDVLANNYKADDLIKHLMVKATAENTTQKLQRIALSLLRVGMTKQHITELPDKKVFLLLQLDQSEGDPMEKTLFTKWVTFLKNKYPVGNDYIEKMFDTLSETYEGKNFLEYLVMKAGKSNQNNTTKQYARFFLTNQVTKWLQMGLSDEAVYKLLQLDKPNSNPLESPLIDQWISFLKTKYPEENHKEKMVDTMAKYFKGYGLIIYLDEVMITGTQKVRRLARSLRIIEIKKWANGGREEAEFWHLVQLIKANRNPLETPSFPMWANRVKRQYETEDTAYEGIFDRLVPHFENKNALVVALNALDRPTNDGTLEIAKQLLDYQYKEWTSEGKTADDVFNNLMPYLPESNIFSSPAFSAWAGFVKSTSSIKEMQPNVEELQEAFKENC